MSTHLEYHLQENSIFFISFTCYQWIPLFELADAYSDVYKWFDYLKIRGIYVGAYVIMPNHIHVLLCFSRIDRKLSLTMSSAKRILAYRIIYRLKKKGMVDVLTHLSSHLNSRELRKGYKHRVFQESYDARECFEKTFLIQKLNYIHNNPVSGKWNLVSTPADYQHSSAAYYLEGRKTYEPLIDLYEYWYGNI